MGSLRWSAPAVSPQIDAFPGESAIIDVAPSDCGESRAYGVSQEEPHAEGRLSSFSHTQYKYGYDGDGNRVIKNPGKLYWALSAMGPLAESDLSGNITAEYVYFDGKRVARIDYPTADTQEVHYYFADHLGSASVITAENGRLEERSEYYPYGGERVVVAGDSNTYKFTGKERDQESGLDNFGARYNSSNLGRFMSPDPQNAGARLWDPQSWNAYAYTRNDPLSLIDPTGMVSCAADDPSHDSPEGDGRGIKEQACGGNQQLAQVDESLAQDQITPQSLAAQVSPEAKAAIMNALNASNSPTADDKEGGFHEESVKWGTDASGNEVVSPSVPGAYAPPGTNPNTNFTPANPATDEKLATIRGFAHIHPKGGGGRSFVQGSSDRDFKFAGMSSGAINLVVGAADKKVYFFNGRGMIGKPMKLKDFMGAK